MDKSGLRKGKKPKDAGGKPKGVGKQKQLSSDEQRQRNIQMAYNTGIGYQQYKKEVDAMRAAKIRERIEQAGIKEE